MDLNLAVIFGPIPALGKKGLHGVVGQVCVQPGRGALRRCRACRRRGRERAGRGVVLVDAEAAPRGLGTLLSKSRLPPAPSTRVEHAVGDGVVAPSKAVSMATAGGAGGGAGRCRAGQGAQGQGALVVVLVTVEDHVDAVIFQKLGDPAHLVVAEGGVAGGERGLVVDDDLPGLGAAVQVVDQPVAQHGRIRRERERRRVARAGRRAEGRRTGAGWRPGRRSGRCRNRTSSCFRGQSAASAPCPAVHGGAVAQGLDGGRRVCRLCLDM